MFVFFLQKFASLGSEEITGVGFSLNTHLLNSVIVYDTTWAKPYKWQI